MSRLLIDTHALLWWFTDDPHLSDPARAAISDEENEILVSAATAWEIATKQRLGKLPGVPEAAARFRELVARNGFTHLPVTATHALLAGAYGNARRDPFDRMLAAQGETEQARLITRDPAFAAFDVETLW